LAPRCTSTHRFLLDCRKLSIPPCDGLTEYAASIVAFPRAFKKRPMDILANLPDVSEPHRRAAIRQLSGKLDRKSDFRRRMYIAAAFLQEIVAFALDQLAERFRGWDPCFSIT
jgi:hypothetical protein